MPFLIALASKLATYFLEKFGVWLLLYIKTRVKLQKKFNAIDEDVKRVEDLVKEIKRRRKEKLPISDKLKKDLKDAMARLNSNTYKS